MAERVDAAKRKLREEAVKAGLARIADDLTKTVAVSIRLTATKAAEKDLGPGSSKMGGTPDLPKGVAWPQRNGIPMALLAQLRLQDVAPYDLQGRLPKSGMLYFFYEASGQAWGFDPKDRGCCAVIYRDDNSDTLRPATPPAGLPQECRFRACRVNFHNEITMPSADSKEFDPKLSENERELLAELADRIGSGERTAHRMFGYPDEIQDDMKLECQLASNGVDVGNARGYSDARRAALEKGADDWQLLLQIDSDAGNLGTMWGDAGRVYFWIRQQDLKKRDFSNVWLILQCY